MKRIIFHIDVNSAFLSWEVAKRVKNGEPDIRKIASCIGGDPNTRRGVVLAKSNEAKKRNVKIGEPLSFALRKCPDLRRYSNPILSFIGLVQKLLKVYAKIILQRWKNFRLTNVSLI